jgi:hypothetical protein
MNFIDFYNESTEKLIGGDGDFKSLKDISILHGVSYEKIKQEFVKGVKEELEHTNDYVVASEIAKDHLTKDPQYYTKLDKSGLGDNEDNINELDISKILTKLKLKNKPLPLDLVDDLVDDDDIFYYSIRSANDSIDDNLIDQSLFDKSLDKSNKEIKQKALAYIRGEHDVHPDKWEESAEEFDEIEILDERKFEKVKMARNLLSKKGNQKAFARDDKGKYILRSKDIKKLMRSIGYVFNDLKSRWIYSPKPKKQSSSNNKEIDNISTPTTFTDEPSEKKEINRNVLLWVGTKKMWINDHETIVQSCVSHLDKFDASNVFIILIKTDDEKTDVLSNKINELYSSNEKIKISIIDANTSSIVDVFSVASQNKINIIGWLTGKEYIQEYENQFLNFKSGKYYDEYSQKVKNPESVPFRDDIVFIDIKNTLNESNKKDLKTILGNVFFVR